MSHSEVDADSARNKLYELMKADLSFEEKAERALERGWQYLGVENGHLTRVDTDTGHWEILVSTDPSGGSFPPGLTLDLDATYCRRTLEAESPIAVHDAPEQGWADDPAFETHGLHCYHGTTITVEGEPFGTVCFVSDEPREPFDESETMFAELVARLLEHELEHRFNESELARREKLVSVLDRVLRHNLRNDVTVIRGRIRQLARKHDVEGYVTEPLVGKLDRLIDLSETARRLDDIATSEFDREPTDVTELARQVAGTVEAEFTTASVRVRGKDGLRALAMPSLSTALRELVENGVKHSTADTPVVRVSVEQTPDAIEITVSDNGPGLPEQEQRLLQAGIETKLEHGSGLGLWLVYWIVSGHDGSIETAVSDAGTEITVRLPRSDVNTDPDHGSAQFDGLPTRDW